MLGLCLLAAAIAPPGPVTPPADFAAKAEAYMAAQVAVNDFSGVVLVAVDGRPVFRRAYGLANREWDVPNTPDAVFRLASVTKQFTAAAVLLLEQQGKLAVSDPVGRHLSDVPKAWADVTLLQLMTHTAGIPDAQPALTFAPGGFTRGYRPKQIIDLVKDRPLDGTPGETFRYSNTGYVLLGMVIEAASGREYGAFLKEAIFDPLGMADTAYERPGAVVRRRATGYTGRASGSAPYLNPTQLYAGGGLVSTADDLLKWDRALAGDHLLGPAAKRTFFAPVKNGYACGVGVGERFGRPMHWHGGALLPFGVRTYLLRHPDAGLCVVVLGNQDWVEPQGIAFDLAAMALGEKYEAPRHKAPPPRRKAP